MSNTDKQQPICIINKYAWIYYDNWLVMNYYAINMTYSRYNNGQIKKILTSGLLCVSTSSGEANWHIKVFCFLITANKKHLNYLLVRQIKKKKDLLHCMCQHLHITLFRRILSFHLKRIPLNRFHFGDVSFCL